MNKIDLVEEIAKEKLDHVYKNIDYSLLKTKHFLVKDISALKNIHLEERKSKYNGNDWVLYLWKLYRTSVRATSETITEIRRNWKLVKITKDMVDRVLSWTANLTEIGNIKYAAKTDPEFFAYFESLRQ